MAPSGTPKAFATPMNRPKVLRERDAQAMELGGISCRILEDGSNTDNRIGTAIFTLPPKAQGPPPIWHEMHDETILVLSGTVRFHLAGGETVDVGKGDYMVFPTKTPGTFSNPGDEDASFFNTFTPAHYTGYFHLLGKLMQEGVDMTPDVFKEAMARFATVRADE